MPMESMSRVSSFTALFALHFDRDRAGKGGVGQLLPFHAERLRAESRKDVRHLVVTDAARDAAVASPAIVDNGAQRFILD